MSSCKVKARRHSLSSLETAKQGEIVIDCSAGKENSALQAERKRKRPLEESEAVAPSKKAAFSISDVAGGLHGTLVGKEELQFSDDLCCLPGGMCGAADSVLYVSVSVCGEAKITLTCSACTGCHPRPFF